VTGERVVIKGTVEDDAFYYYDIKNVARDMLSISAIKITSKGVSNTSTTTDNSQDDSINEYEDENDYENTNPIDVDTYDSGYSEGYALGLVNDTSEFGRLCQKYALAYQRNKLLGLQEGYKAGLIYASLNP
jgi:hypothetical protein